MELPVTIVITRRVKPDSVAAFKQTLRDWLPKIESVPGYLGLLLLAPPPGGTEYGAVFKFRTADDWRAYREWPEYKAFLESLRPMLETDPRVQELRGLEAWFTPQPNKPAPQRWRLILLTWVGVNLASYPLNITIKAALESAPFFVAYLAVNAAVVGTLTWIMMPILTKLFGWWIYPR